MEYAISMIESHGYRVVSLDALIFAVLHRGLFYNAMDLYSDLSASLRDGIIEES